MDVVAAQNLVDYLAAGVRGYWPSSTRDAWTEKFMELSDTMCAERAVTLLVEKWTSTTPPSYGVFKSTYDQQVHLELMEQQRRDAETRGLPAGNRQGVRQIDYLLGLAVKAEEGDPRAAREIEDWRRILRGPLAEALPGSREAKEWIAEQPPLIDS